MQNKKGGNPIYTVVYAIVFALIIAVFTRLVSSPYGAEHLAFFSTLVSVAFVFLLSFRLLTNARLLTGRAAGHRHNK